MATKTNEELYEAALNAIGEMFSDVSVSRAATKENLRSLLYEIQIMLETLRDTED
jgi:hypothetical protein